MALAREDTRGAAWFSQAFGRYVYAARARAFRALDRLPRPSRKPKLLLVDPGLIGFNGHHFEFTRLMKQFFARDFSVTVYSNYSAANAVVARLRARPIFYDGPYPRYRPGEFNTIYAALTRSTALGLSRIPLQYMRTDTLVVMHTITSFQLGGVASWYADLAPSLRPKLFLQFQFPLDHDVHEADRSAALAFAREAASSLAQFDNVCLSCNSRPMAAQIERQTGQACLPMPLPIKWPIHIGKPDGNAVFGFFGGLRAEKGSKLLAGAIPEFARRHPDVQFIIHAPAVESDEASVRVLRTVKQVELIPHNFGDKDSYFANFCRANCILLAYDPKKYSIRTSGIMLEALGLGRLTITTRGTWMEEELSPYPEAGVVMPEYTANALCDALERAHMMLRNGFQLAPKPEIIARHSGPAFCSRLLDIMAAKNSSAEVGISDPRMRG